jgi:nitric oxide reductase subunit B
VALDDGARIVPALRQRNEERPILIMFSLSSTAIATFYAAALGYGRHTNLAIAVGRRLSSRSSRRS